MSCLTPEEFATIRRHPMLRTRDEFRAIVETVCAEFGVDPAAISAPNRGPELVCEARNLICVIASQRGFSGARIARMINRKPPTVWHALKLAVKAMGADSRG